MYEIKFSQTLCEIIALDVNIEMEPEEGRKKRDPGDEVDWKELARIFENFMCL